MENDNDLFIIDNSRGFDREIPYLENGSSGVALVMLEFQKEDSSYLNESRKNRLSNFIKGSNLSCSANGGLFSGYAGFIPIANAVSNIYGNTDMLEFLLENLNNYLVRNSDNEILFPGEFGFKCSLDLSHGSAGVLLVLNDIKSKKRCSWIPLLSDSINLFSL